MMEDILFAPFEWITIPAGTITLVGAEGNYIAENSTQIFDVAAFKIAKYPITHAQYAKFAWKGYDPAETNHPVTEVAWQNVLDFCEWLSEKSGLKISLPTEQQWQWAAQSDTDWRYPWGNEFAGGHCNTAEAGVGFTTPVTQFSNGASPYGVLDMSGNVWEWTSTDWYIGNDIASAKVEAPIIRGGAYSSGQDDASVLTRNYMLPSLRNPSLGFRIVQTLA